MIFARKCQNFLFAQNIFPEIWGMLHTLYTDIKTWQKRAVKRSSDHQIRNCISASPPQTPPRLLLQIILSYRPALRIYYKANQWWAVYTFQRWHLHLYNKHNITCESLIMASCEVQTCSNVQKMNTYA